MAHTSDEKGSIQHTDHYTSATSPANHSISHQPTISLTAEQYERLFFQPGGPPKSSLSRQFGNPTALGVISFVMVLTPTSCFLMMLDATDGTSAVAIDGVYFLLGGLGLFVSGLLEWVIGNTYPFIVFCTFGGFWLSFGFLNDPAQQITQAFQGGSSAVDYNTGLMFYWIFWVILVTIYLAASLRTNLAFVEIFAALWFNFFFLALGYNMLAHGDTSHATMFLKVAGGFGLAAAIGGWYIAAGLVMEAVQMPFTIPFGDLSTRFLNGRMASDMENRNSAKRD